MQRYLLLALAGGVVVALGLYAFYALTPQKPLKSAVIVAFGDSLTYGTGATTGNEYVSLLSKEVGMPIINLGVPGDTTERALARVESVFPYKPDIVLVLLGGNDALQSVPLETTFRNLDTLITTLQSFESKRVRVLLIGVRGRALLGDPYEKPFAELAKTRGVTFVPNVLAGVFGRAEYMSADGIHPNDAGYAKMAAKIYPSLKALLQE